MSARRSAFVVALVVAACAASIASSPSRSSAQPAPPARAAAPAAQTIVAVVGATIHTGAGDVIEEGTVIIEGGSIKQIGRGLAPPAGAEIIDAKGAIVTPGFVDPLTSIGLVEVTLEKGTRDDARGGEEKSDRIRAGFRASDGYNPASAVIPVTRAEGVTSAGVIPSGGLISGQSLWADLDGQGASDAIARSPLAIHVHLDAEAVVEGGHATAILRVREALDDARSFSKARAAWERNQSRPFAASRLDLEALTSAVTGKVPVVVHVDRAAEIVTTLALAREFGLRAVIAGGAEAWKVAKDLAASKTPVILRPLDSDPTSFDTLGARADCAAILQRAGVLIALSTGETHNARKLRQVAGNAVRGGLPHEAAIEAVTRGPAEALGMAARYGTLAPGKVANLVVWSGDPFELSTRVRAVIIHGRRASLRTRQTELLDRYRKLSR